MTDSKDNSDEKRENIFEILDEIMFQVSRTKKMFMIMILTVLILPPLALLIVTSVLDSPDERLEMRLQEKLQSGEITEEEYQELKEKGSDKKPITSKFFFPTSLTIFVISLVWLGIGIRQWIVLSKWDKKYQRFKKKQDDVDKKLDDDSDN